MVSLPNYPRYQFWSGTSAIVCFWGGLNSLVVTPGSDQNERIKKCTALNLLMKHEGKNYAKSISQSYKSWGEEQIARLLDRNQIAYQYEYPLAVIDRGKARLNYPDFRLRDFGIIIEYFGVNGDGGYDERAKHKMEVYKQAGIDGLYLTRDSLRGDWPDKVMGQIEDILKNRLDRFYGRRKYDASK